MLLIWYNKYYREVIKSIALDNQLISLVEDQGFLHYLEFLNPRHPTISALHYIYSTFELQSTGMRTSFMGLIQQSM